MNLNKLAAYFLPAFAMFSISALTMLGAFGTTKENLAIFSLALIIVYPITFIIQGVSCAIHHYQVIPALGISLIAFIIIFFVVIGGNNTIYGIYYFALFGVGYGITYLLRRMKK